MSRPVERDPSSTERFGRRAGIDEPERSLLAIGALALAIALHPAVPELWYRDLPAALAVVVGLFQMAGPIPFLVLLAVIGPRLWRAGVRTRLVGIGALVAACAVSAWGFAIILANFGLRPH